MEPLEPLENDTGDHFGGHPEILTMKIFICQDCYPWDITGALPVGIPDPIHDFSNFPPGLYSAQWRKESAPGGAATQKNPKGLELEFFDVFFFLPPFF